MANPKVSIVIPVFNVENYLVQCMDAAVNQTLRDIEIIPVDDGSTDSSGAILDSYAEKDERVKVIHKKNAGYGAAMNSGLDAATGDYFYILESDDYCRLDSVERLYEAAEKYHADVVRSDYYDLTTENGKDYLQAKQITTDVSYYNRLINPSKEKEVYQFVMHNWNGIYNMKFLRDHEIRYNETPGASYQDNGFYFQVFTQTERLVYVQGSYYCYRNDNLNSSFRSKGKVYAPVQEYAFIRSFLEKHPEFEMDMLPVFYMRMFRIYHQTYQRIDSSFKKEFLEVFYNAMNEARNLHMLDTGLFTIADREKLELLLNNPRLYASMIDSKDSGIMTRMRALIRYVHYLSKMDGIRSVSKKIKSRLLGC